MARIGDYEIDDDVFAADAGHSDASDVLAKALEAIEELARVGKDLALGGDVRGALEHAASIIQKDVLLNKVIEVGFEADTSGNMNITSSSVNKFVKSISNLIGGDSEEGQENEATISLEEIASKLEKVSFTQANQDAILKNKVEKDDKEHPDIPDVDW